MFTMALFSYFGLSGSVNSTVHLHLCLFGSYRVIYSNDGTRTKPFLEVEAKYSFDHHNGWGDPACDRNLAFWLLRAAPLDYVTLFGILGYVLFVSFLINDLVKVYLIRKLSNNINFSKAITKYG